MIQEKAVVLYGYITIGKWELIKDTVIFSWESNWTESSDSIISSTDFKNNNIQIKFLYDDGKPIANVKTSLILPLRQSIQKNIIQTLKAV